MAQCLHVVEAIPEKDLFLVFLDLDQEADVVLHEELF